MRAIRAYHHDCPLYKNIFMEVAKMPKENYWRLCSHRNPDYVKALNNIKGSTNILTATRQYLADKGFEEAVKQADTRFLKERINGQLTAEEYDAEWLKHIECIPEDYPEDAL